MVLKEKDGDCAITVVVMKERKINRCLIMPWIAAEIYKIFPAYLYRYERP